MRFTFQMKKLSEGNKITMKKYRVHWSKSFNMIGYEDVQAKDEHAAQDIVYNMDRINQLEGEVEPVGSIDIKVVEVHETTEEKVKAKALAYYNKGIWDLNGEIHNLKSVEASKINDLSTEEQIEYIIQTAGVEYLNDIVGESVEDDS